MATPMNATYKLPKIANEPNLHYKPDSPERAALQAELKKMEAAAPFYVPAFVNGKEVSYHSTAKLAARDGAQLKRPLLAPQVPASGPQSSQPMPHKHAKTLATFSTSSPELTSEAIESALAAKSEWESMPFSDRAAIFLKVSWILDILLLL